LLQCRAMWVKRFEPFQNLNGSNKFETLKSLKRGTTFSI
jgi:hypothetical protein